MLLDNDYSMSARERQLASVLVVEKEQADLQNFRRALTALGYGTVQTVNDHDSALKIIQERNFSHLMFASSETSIGPREFLQKALTLDSRCVAIATSYEPQVDDVFDLLRLGARGFLVKPFNTGSLEAAIVHATKGEPFSQAILEASDRNEAFAALLAANFDKLADIMRTSRGISSRDNLIERQKDEFLSAIRLARCFAKDGEDALRARLVDFLISLADGPATRLGRLRKRLSGKRRPRED